MFPRTTDKYELIIARSCNLQTNSVHSVILKGETQRSKAKQSNNVIGSRSIGKIQYHQSKFNPLTAICQSITVQNYRITAIFVQNVYKLTIKFNTINQSSFL